MSTIHLSGEFNLTFVHVPRTAGTSITSWIHQHKGKSKLNEWWSHPTSEMIHSWGFDKNFTFSVVRNPWDRILSVFTHFKRVQLNEPWWAGGDRPVELMHTNSITYIKNNPTLNFEKFINDLPSLTQDNDAVAIRNQVEWTKDCDLVIKFENLDEGFKQVQNIFNNHKSLSLKNISYHQEYQKYYNDSTKNLIAKWFEDDINKWEYVF